MGKIANLHNYESKEMNDNAYVRTIYREVQNSKWSVIDHETTASVFSRKIVWQMRMKIWSFGHKQTVSI